MFCQFLFENLKERLILSRITPFGVKIRLNNKVISNFTTKPPKLQFLKIVKKFVIFSLFFQ